MKNRVKKRALTFAAVMAMVLGGGMQLYAADKLADTVYHNGKIYTVTETAAEAREAKEARTVDVVATLNGKIIFAGSKADAQSKGLLISANVNKIVDLRGKTMLPGFVDGHGHFPQQGEADLYKVNLNSPLLDGTVNSMDKLIEALANKAKVTPPGQPIVGDNYDDTQLIEQTHPTRYDLDKASSEHPILVRHISGHMSVANSAALALYGVDKNTQQEGLVKDKDGEPTGLLLEGPAMNLVPLKVKSNPLQNVSRADQVYAAAGVTTGDSGTTPVVQDVPVFQKALLKNRLNIRLAYHPMGYYGTSVDMFGWMNRAALGWADDGTPDRYTDGSNALPGGSDITSLPVVMYSKPGQGIPYEQIDPTYAPVRTAKLPENHIFLGAWKLLEDGSPQGYTAWMKKPGFYDWGQYTEADSFNKAGYFNGLPGTRYMTTEELTHGLSIYHKYGHSTETHTNGSAAAEAWVTALENIVSMYPEVKDTRHTSIHGQTVERQQIQRLVGDYAGLNGTAGMYEELDGAFKDGVVDTTLNGKLPNGNLPELMAAQHHFVSFFDNHTYFYGYRHTNKFFGPGRAYNMSPAGWAEAYGMPYSFHNDTFVTPISPLRSIQSGVTRVSGDALEVLGQKNIEVNGTGKDVDATVDYKERSNSTETRKFWTYDQRVSTLQALRAVTIAPAYQNKLEDRVGSIAEGKLADFVIMDKNIFDVAQTEPLTIAKLRVAATIVGDKVVHGVLPDTDFFVNSFRVAYDQPALDTDVTLANSQYIDHATAEKDYAALNDGEKRFGTVSFMANVDAGSSAVFQMNLLGNGEKLSSFKLYKMTANQKAEYAYGRPDSASMASASGQWWVADFTNPTVALSQDAVLEMDKQYIAFFIIKDNDATFDADQTAGVIVDPVSLVTTSGTMPSNGGSYQPGPAKKDDGGSSSGGCTVGSTPSYDLMVLFLGFTAVAAIRVLRRRDSE